MSGFTSKFLLQFFCCLWILYRGLLLRFMTDAKYIFIFSQAFRPSVGPIQPPVQWVPGALWQLRAKLLTYPRDEPCSRMRGSVTSLPPTRLCCALLLLACVIGKFYGNNRRKDDNGESSLWRSFWYSCG